MLTVYRCDRTTLTLAVEPGKGKGIEPLRRALQLLGELDVQGRISPRNERLHGELELFVRHVG